MYPRSLRTAFPLLDCGGFDVVLSTAHVPEVQIFRELVIGGWLFLLSHILTGVTGYISKTYCELTEEQINRLADEVAAYTEWVEKRNWPDKRPREVEIVQSVTRLKEILKIADKRKRPIALLNAIEGAHSLQGRDAGKAVKPGQDEQVIEQEILTNLPAQPVGISPAGAARAPDDPLPHDALP